MEHEPPTSFLLARQPPPPAIGGVYSRSCVCGSRHVRTSGSKGLFTRGLNGVPLHPPTQKPAQWAGEM